MLPNLVVKKAPSFSESWGWSDRTLSWIIRMKKSLTCHHTQVQSGHFYHTTPCHHIVGYFLVALLTTIVKWAGSIAETLRLHTKSCSSHCLSSQVDQFCPVLHLWLHRLICRAQNACQFHTPRYWLWKWLSFHLIKPIPELIHCWYIMIHNSCVKDIVPTDLLTSEYSEFADPAHHHSQNRVLARATKIL